MPLSRPAFLTSLALAALAMTALVARAQSTMGTIRGNVADGQGLALPGVIVTATSPNLQGQRLAVTAGNGDYVLTVLPPGTYTLSFELPGFERVERSLALSKGTLAVTSASRIQGAFTTFTDKQINNTFNPAASMDPNSLETRETPQDLLAVSFNGAVRSNLFVEALFSKRNLTLIGTGARSRDLVDGTLMIDAARGFRYWSATFCGVCDPEQRDNDDVYLKATYCHRVPDLQSVRDEARPGCQLGVRAQFRTAAQQTGLHDATTVPAVAGCAFLGIGLDQGERAAGRFGPRARRRGPAGGREGQRLGGDRQAASSSSEYVGDCLRPEAIVENLELSG